MPDAVGDSVLARLAGDCGIQSQYDDIWGRRHRADDSVLRALLVEFGVVSAVESESHEALTRALAARNAARWTRWLEPVVVAAGGRESFSVRVNVPGFAVRLPMRWQIEAEGGVARGAEFMAAAYPEIERTQLDGELVIGYALRIDDVPPVGYHRLNVFDPEGRVRASAQLLVAPPRCFLPPPIEQGHRLWGPTVQLYAVRSARNWGIGDFTDLGNIAAIWAAQGADLVGVSPLHALFPHNPRHASPYSPSSRLYRNVLHIDVEAVPEFASCQAARVLVASRTFQQRLTAARHASLVDHDAVRTLKFEVLELLFSHLRDAAANADARRRDEFDDFVRQGGAALYQHALHEAAQESLHAQDPAIWGWPAWPAALQDAASPALGHFANAHPERIAFYQYLQWNAEQQLDHAARRARQAGMAVGLYVDVAVSVDGAGSETWTDRDVYARGLRIGAPPDEFNPKGQDWGLPPWNPEALRAAGHAPFVALLRANMRHAGALRLDHVMGLMRLYVIAAGLVSERGEARGAYVHYPFDELLAIVAIESHRHRCLVIGEDLGTVPDIVRTSLHAAGVLSYRLLYFERDHGSAFRSPADWPQQALAAVSTHDLPTLAGWWENHDLVLRESLDLLPSAEFAAEQRGARLDARRELLRALTRERLLPPGAGEADVTRPLRPSLANAVHAYVMRCRSAVAVVQVEDVFGMREQFNLPGTTDQHANWRRKLVVALEHWGNDERFLALAGVCRAERPPLRPLPSLSADGASLATPSSPPAAAPPRTVIPRATYRLQLGHGMTFERATRLLPYLADLGISHVYCSPYLRARAGSAHGYDIIDHRSLNPEIGTRTDFDRFVAGLRAYRMGHIADIVPNHMGVMRADNAWWLDVLEHGRASDYARFFDIDWDSRDPALRDKVLLPLLGDHYGRVLERGELQLGFDAASGSLAVHYFEHRFPLDSSNYPALLERAAAVSSSAQALTAAARTALVQLIDAWRRLPPRETREASRLVERRRDSVVLKQRLAMLVAMYRPVADAIEAALAECNGRAGDPASFATLDALLESQAYRLASWRVAADEINYRRFFDINELAALRMEEEVVFEATHAWVLELAAAGAIDGLRIDHPDGLFDPAQYFRRLQQRYRRAVVQLAAERDGYAPAVQRGGHAAVAEEDVPPLFVVIEKIAASHEQVPQDWPVFGTTGYRFAALVNGLFVDARHEEAIDRIWRAFVGDEAQDFAGLAWNGRRQVMDEALTSETAVLSNRLLRIARADRRTRDFTQSALRQALMAVAACFPVYRTYIDGPEVTRQDRRFIEWAVASARRRVRSGDPSVFEFVRAVLLARLPGASPRLQADALDFARRFQQFTAPVAAKGIEDTAFYRFNRLLSLNEVGANPEEFGMSVAAWHGASADRCARWTHTMLATTTHDTKRSEDMRNRLNVLSELPTEWRNALRRWNRLNRRHRRIVGGQVAPARNDEYVLYQLLLGSCPQPAADDRQMAAWRDRVEAAWMKSAREARVRTSWTRRNAAYEAALSAFVRGLLEPAAANLFIADLRQLVERFAWYGLLNSVSTALLKFCSPGVPDLYQGSEVVNLRMVDPDNRAAVDFDAMRSALARLQSLAAERKPGASLRELFAGDGSLAKLWATWRTLNARREATSLFESGAYVPLEVVGRRADHVVAFGRRDAQDCAIVVASRLHARLGAEVGELPLGAGLWGDTAIDLSPLDRRGRFVDALSGAALDIDGPTLPMTKAWTVFPGALWQAREGAGG